MKLVVVGESGLGKTTFTKNLFAAYSSVSCLGIDPILHQYPCVLPCAEYLE